jgi:hypothetical protein
MDKETTSLQRKKTPDKLEWWREMLEERAFADEAVERFTNNEAVERANKAIRSIIDVKHERGEAVDLGDVTAEALWVLDPDDIRARLILNRQGAAA